MSYPDDPLKNAPPGTGELLQVARDAAKKGPPPVHLWNPPHCGEIDMRIARDGTWFYQGTPIGRPALVRLFASILRKDEEGYVLVTPVEKVAIRVDDAPFVAVDFSVGGAADDPVLTFETNVGDLTVAGPENAIRVAEDPKTGEPAPYVHVRRGLEALIDRKSFYRLADRGEEMTMEGAPKIAVRSSGVWFAIGPAA